MPVTAQDIKYRQSTSTDSLGGAISQLVVPTGLNLYYSDVDQQEAETGSVAYRCMYIINENLTDTFNNVELFVVVRTPSPSTYVELGKGSSGLNGVEQTITDESIAPAGVTFSPTSSAQPLLLGNLGPGDFFPVWIQRNVLPLAVGAANDNVIFAVQGDPA